MKKTLATIIGVCGMAACVNAQGTFFLDTSANAGNGSTSSATTGGLVWLNPSGVLSEATLDTSTDVSIQVLWGTTAGNVNNVLNLDPLGLNGAPANTSWLAGKPTGQTDISFNANGTIVDPNGIAYAVPGQAAGSQIFVSMLAWTGAATSWDQVTANGANQGLKTALATTPFAVTLALNTSPIQPDLHNIGAVVLQPVPEPGMFALAGLGAAALMAARRRK